LRRLANRHAGRLRDVETILPELEPAGLALERQFPDIVESGLKLSASTDEMTHLVNDLFKKGEGGAPFRRPAF
jgi:hypothetical protein